MVKTPGSRSCTHTVVLGIMQWTHRSSGRNPQLQKEDLHVVWSQRQWDQEASAVSSRHNSGLSHGNLEENVIC